MAELKSKIVSKKDIDWTRVIVIDDLKIDPQVLEMHKSRIDTVFKNKSEQERNMQLSNIVARDNIFNKAMDFLITDYVFEIDPEEVKQYAESIVKNWGEEKKPYANEIAEKLLQKTLIFNDLQKEYKIDISDDELTNILQDYYQETNQPIRDFMQDEARFQAAKQMLLEEKTTAFIVDKFPRDMSAYEKKLYDSLNKAEAKEGK